MDLNVYLALATWQEQAKYLLQQEITLTLDRVGLTPVARALAGGVPLPIVNQPGDTTEQVIAKAKAWLQKAAEDKGIAVDITHWQKVQLRPEVWIDVPARAEVTIESKPSRMHVELLANALVSQAKELRECGPDEWESVSDMIEGSLNNIRLDMKESA
ncbi:hypothetical protein Q7I21_07855 [Aeromonas veronii]|uniref:hypothetical protein n=1 Tax=Aeromonas veronii TaxID=654 RepID=UPI003007AD56